MNVFIVGAGQIGTHLAQVLAAENHDVTVIESNPERVEEVDFALDVRVVSGSGTSTTLLRELQVDQAGLFVAATGTDEVNLVAAALAKKLGVRRTVARVGSQGYHTEALELASAFRIDHVISAQELTARMAVSYLDHPGFFVMDDFAGGRVHAFSFQIDSGPLLDTPLSGISIPEHTLIGLIRRNQETIIPRGKDVIQKGDVVTFIGKSHKIQIMEDQLKKKLGKNATVTIAGASSLGLFIAQKLEHYRYNVKLIENNRDRCEAAALILRKAEVIHSDATSLDLLREERIDTSSVFIAATDKDDRNILMALLARELGIPHCLPVVRQPDFAILTSHLGLNQTLTPRVIFSSRILKMTLSPEILSRKTLEEEQAEILEFLVRDDAKVVDRIISEIEWPPGSLVAAIVRKNKVFVAQGPDPVRARDQVVMIAKKNVVQDVIRLFSP